MAGDLVLQEHEELVTNQHLRMRVQQEKGRIGRSCARFGNVAIMHPGWQTAEGVSYLAQCIQASVLKLWMREDSAQLTRVNLGDLWVFAQRFPQYEYWYRDDSGSHMLPMAWE